MVLPFLLGAAAIGAGVKGIQKGVQAVSDNSKAKNIYEKSQNKYQETERDLNYYRRNTGESLKKLGTLKLAVWDEQLGRFIGLFEQLNNVELTGQANVEEMNAARFTDDELKQMKSISLKAQEALLGGAGALGSGALAGVAAYGGAMMFASASTGTAISTLAGAAATNATLAWFGGGALAAGGFGMAGGVAVLGGIVAGPVLAVGGMMIAAKARENLANAKKYKAKARKAVEEMNNAIAVLEAINDVARQFDGVITKLSQGFVPVLDDLESIIAYAGKDYAFYTQEQKQQVHIAVQFAQLLKLVLETPLLTSDGAVDRNCFKALQKGQKALSSNS